jgi:HK97 family phage major capsid protein
MDKIVRPGGAIKARKADDMGYLDGYLCLFGDERSRDTDGQYFTADTDYGPMKSSVVLYHHGQDATLKNTVLDTDAAIGMDDAGVWIRAQLDLRDDYQRAIYELADRGYMGWSAGTLPVHFEAEASGRIRKFYLGLDASLTPTPADIRNLATTIDGELPSAVKSALVDLFGKSIEAEAEAQGGEPVVDASNETTADNPEYNKSHHEDGDTMTEIQNNEVQQPDVQPSLTAEDVQGIIDGAMKSSTASLAELVREQIEKAIAADKPVVKAGFNINMGADEPADEIIIKGWDRFIRQGDTQAYREAVRKAALNETTDSEGGYLVPRLYSDQLVTPINEGSYLRAAGANVVPVRGTDSFRVPTLTHAAAAVLTAEAGAFDQKEPTLGEVEFIPYKYTRLSKASEEVLADSRFDVFNNVLTPDGVYGFVQAENVAFTTGDGSSKPQGVVTGASVGVNLAGAAAITGDEVIDLYYSLEPEYAARATWMMNSKTAAAIRKLKAGGTNEYIWQPSLAAGEPPTILGRPVVINNSMADLGASAKPLLFGDLSFYWIADFAVDETGNTGIYVQRLNELYAANGQVGFRWFKRMDGHVMLSAAIKVAQNATA